MSAQQLVLELPWQDHKKAVEIFCKEFVAADEEIVGGLGVGTMPFDQWLSYSCRNRTSAGALVGRVPSTTYLTLEENRVVGIVNLRHRLNYNLRLVGGHIGYSIAPSQRGKGYGTRQLTLALEPAKALGLSRVLLTCDKGNPASAHVIEAVGGILQREGVVDGEIIKYYWIPVG